MGGLGVGRVGGSVHTLAHACACLALASTNPLAAQQRAAPPLSRRRQPPRPPPPPHHATEAGSGSAWRRRSGAGGLDGQWAGVRTRHAACCLAAACGRPLPPPAPPPLAHTRAASHPYSPLTSSSRERSPGAPSSDATAKGAGAIGGGFFLSTPAGVSHAPPACARRPGVPWELEKARVWPELGETSSSLAVCPRSRGCACVVFVLVLFSGSFLFASTPNLVLLVSQSRPAKTRTNNTQMAAPQLEWAGLFRWSMKHQDGTRPTAASAMSEADRKW